MKLADLISYVLPEVPGANVIAIERALLGAAREFCSRTWIWTDKKTFTIRAGREFAALSARLPAKSAACGLVAWESDDTSVAPALRRANTEVFVDESPDVDTAYTLTLALMPSDSADEIPDWMGAFRVILGAYAKHELMMQPEKTWTNPARAQVLYQIFTDAVNDEKRNRNNSRLRGRMRVRVPGVR